jgi:hypothetical protein
MFCSKFALSKFILVTLVALTCALGNIQMMRLVGRLINY